jgi:hypothetical protein
MNTKFNIGDLLYFKNADNKIAYIIDVQDCGSIESHIIVHILSKTNYKQSKYSFKYLEDRINIDVIMHYQVRA